MYVDRYIASLQVKLESLYKMVNTKKYQGPPFKKDFLN